MLSLCSWEADSLTTKYVSAWRGIELEISGLKDMSCLQNKDSTFKNYIFFDRSDVWGCFSRGRGSESIHKGIVNKR